MLVDALFGLAGPEFASPVESVDWVGFIFALASLLVEVARLAGPAVAGAPARPSIYAAIGRLTAFVRPQGSEAVERTDSCVSSADRIMRGVIIREGVARIDR